MTQLIAWAQVCDPKFVISEKHRRHQKKMHLQLAAVEARKAAYKDLRFRPYRPYNGNLF